MTAPPVVDPVVRHLGRALLPRVDEFAQQAFRVGGREPKATVTGASMGVRPGSSGAPLQPATGTGHPRGQHRSRKGAHSWCSPAYVGRVGVREQYGNLEHTAVVRARSMAPIGRPAGWLSTLVALLWMSRTTLAAKSVSHARCPIHGWAVHWRATSSAIRARCAVVRKISLVLIIVDPEDVPASIPGVVANS